MRNFVKENWYKLMIGSSMMMVSFGFMIYAVSPAYSSNNDNKVEIPSSQKTTSTVGANGVRIDDAVFFVDGGYIYYHYELCKYPNEWNQNNYWKKHKLP
jgi:hypothetical protein